MKDIFSILKTYWGYQQFRSLQEDIIRSVLHGADSLALLPTGGGKSLCFQVPAMAMDGLCLVISPLIALMKDQVENLRKKGITAFAIHSGMTRKEVIQTLRVAGNSNCKFLYVSPERLETNLFKEYLPSLNVCLIAVDEGHCISQWGYDFRPSYLRIAALREELPHVPVLALTASATAEVQRDICTKLLFKKELIFRKSFERPNLSYSVFQVSSKINRIVDILSKVPGTAIVYCRSRKRTKELSDLLNLNNISADFYHAGLLPETRNEKQQCWLQNKVRVMVCTNAFGMGIDKPDVRIVVHADIPDCLENYYQEAGRAGRDGIKSYAVLLYSDKEIEELRASIDIRFPGVDEIKKIYKCLMNFLQVPAGTGEGNSYDFEISSFLKSFNLGTLQVLSVFKTLEQEEHLHFSEQVYVPSKVQVTAHRNLLEESYQSNPATMELLKCLLRTYEGIIDHEVNIQEYTIARAVKITPEQATIQLRQLHAAGIIRYIPQKEKPQVYFLTNRVISDDLRIDMEKYRKRKLQAEKRVEEMVRYVHTTTSCRSEMIGRYFGDEEIKQCGICDNCLEQKRKPVEGDEFDLIQHKILKAASSRAISFKQLLQEMSEHSTYNTKEVLRYLQAEDKIVVDENGKIRKNTD